MDLYKEVHFIAVYFEWCDKMKSEWVKGILFIATGFFWFSQYSYIPYFNPYLNSLGIGATMAGLIGGAYGITQVALRMPVGIMADRFQSHKMFIILGMLCSTAVGFGFFFCKTPIAFLIFRGMAGVSSSTWVAFTVLYASYFDDDKTVEAVSKVVSANYLGKLAGFFLGGLVAQHIGVEYTFLLSGVAGFIGLICSLFLTGGEMREDPINLFELAAVVKDRNLIYSAILGIFGQIMAYGSIYTYTSDLAKQAGATPYQLSVMNILLVIPVVLFAYFSTDFFLKKFGANKMISGAFVMMMIYCAVIPFAGPIWEFYTLSLFVGLGNGIIFAMLTGLSIKNIPTDKKSTAMGFFQSSYGIGMTIGPIVTGVVIDLSEMTPAFFLLSGVCLVGAVMAYRCLDKKQRGDSVTPDISIYIGLD